MYVNLKITYFDILSSDAMQMVYYKLTIIIIIIIIIIILQGFSKLPALENYTLKRQPWVQHAKRINYDNERQVNN